MKEASQKRDGLRGGNRGIDIWNVTICSRHECEQLDLYRRRLGQDVKCVMQCLREIDRQVKQAFLSFDEMS